MTGAGGFIGRHLTAVLLGRGDRVRALRHRPDYAWGPLDGAEVVFHLAGEPVAQRWSAAARERIRASRVDGTAALVGGLKKLRRPPAVLVCASAIGIYGSRGDEVLDERSAAGSGFLADVCQGWEHEARRAEAFGTRVVLLRTGLVLGRCGGALEHLVPLFRLGLGGRLGDGRQWMSWIHITDLARLAVWAADTRAVSGPVNAVAPQPVTNQEFTRTLGRLVDRPALIPAPAFALRLALGEMSTMLLEGQRVAPGAALAGGFRFEHPGLEETLAGLL
jgi:uncharacterized protein (TIGR01777 family)